MSRWQSFKREVASIGKWLVMSIVFVRDQFTFLRAEHIRSVAFLFICWQGERSWRRMPADAEWTDPDFIITMACLVAAIGLAWQATEATVKIAGLQFQLGQTPDAADDGFAQNLKQMREQVVRGTRAVDDPDSGRVQ